MSRYKKLLSGILAFGMLFTLSAVAFAAQHTEYPYGGTWNWGERYTNDIKYAYSDYYLTYSSADKTNGVHKTTVTGKTSSTSDWVASGKWAKSAIECRWNAIERCYYNAKDLNGNPKA